MTVPGGATARTGPVSGPAMYAPLPCSQMRSLHPSGKISASPSRSPGTMDAHRQATMPRSGCGGAHSA